MQKVLDSASIMGAGGISNMVKIKVNPFRRKSFKVFTQGRVR